MSSTVPLIVQPGIDDAPSATDADFTKPPAGAVSKSPLLSRPVVQKAKKSLTIVSVNLIRFH
jgi:hypothetical protein